MPRFIISVRELYDRDTRACWQGVDTGFGVLSQPLAGENGAVSAIAFADVVTAHGQGQVAEGDAEGIRLEELGANKHQFMEGDADTLGAIRLGLLGDGTHQV